MNFAQIILTWSRWFAWDSWLAEYLWVRPPWQSNASLPRGHRGCSPPPSSPTPGSAAAICVTWRGASFSRIKGFLGFRNVREKSASVLDKDKVSGFWYSGECGHWPAVSQMFCYLRHKKWSRAVITVCGVSSMYLWCNVNNSPLVSVIIDTGDSQENSPESIMK